jgi:hypothetical protein
VSERLESTPPVGKSRRAAAPTHASSPEGRKAHVAPSVSALPTKVMAVGTLGGAVAGMRVRSGGKGGGEGGGGEGGGEGGGGEGGGEGGGGEGGGGEGDGDEGGGEGGGGKEGGDGGGDGSCGGGGAGQAETVPETPVRVVAQEQTVPPWT